MWPFIHIVARNDSKCKGIFKRDEEKKGGTSAPLIISKNAIGWNKAIEYLITYWAVPRLLFLIKSVPIPSSDSVRGSGIVVNDALPPPGSACAWRPTPSD